MTEQEERALHKSWVRIAQLVAIKQYGKNVSTDSVLCDLLPFDKYIKLAIHRFAYKNEYKNDN